MHVAGDTRGDLPPRIIGQVTAERGTHRGPACAIQKRFHQAFVVGAVVGRRLNDGFATCRRCSECRASVMQTVPLFLATDHQEIISGRSSAGGNSSRCCFAFFCSAPGGVGLRQMFERGVRLQFLRTCQDVSARSSVVQVSEAHLRRGGEGFQGTLIGAHAGTCAALRALTNLERRSAVPRERLSHFRWTQISSWLAAACPSGMHSDHHFPLLERPSLAQVAPWQWVMLLRMLGQVTPDGASGGSWWATLKKAHGGAEVNCMAAL